MGVGIASVAVAAIIAASFVFYAKRRFTEAQKEVGLLYPEHSRLLSAPMANFFGLRSAGMKQVRGNGILVLTESRLYFRMLVPRREVTIPLERIKNIETPGSFLGKTKGGRLLQIDFVDDQGRQDSAAWMVPGLEQWTEKLSVMSGLER